MSPESASRAAAQGGPPLPPPANPSALSPCCGSAPGALSVRTTRPVRCSSCARRSAACPIATRQPPSPAQPRADIVFALHPPQQLPPKRQSRQALAKSKLTSNYFYVL